VYEQSYYSLGIRAVHILITVRRCERMWRINRCRSVSSKAEGSNRNCLTGAAENRGGMLVTTVGAFQWDGVASPGCCFIVSSLKAALISTTMGITGVGGRANRAGGGGFLTELGWVAKLAAVAALSDEGSGEHFLAFTWAGEEANRVFKKKGLVWRDTNDDGGGGLRSVSGVRFEKTGGVDCCSCRIPDGDPHGVQEIGEGCAEHVNGKIVDSVVGGRGGKIEGCEGVIFNR